MSSASAIADELVTVLEAISNAEATKSMYNLDTATNRYVFVVRPVSSQNKPAQFGSSAGQANFDRDLRLRADCFVKDLGDPDEYMNAQYTICNSVETQLDDYSSLNSTCDYAYLERWEVPDVELQIAGMVFQPIRFYVRCLAT